MIIGLSGLKQSGKDSIAAYLIKEHGFERRAFADPLKRSVAALLDIPYHKIDEWKNNPDVRVDLSTIGRRDYPVIGGEVNNISSFTFREFLQRYGTESHRDVFGSGFWVDQTMPIDGFYAGRKMVITDTRFVDEAERICFIGGFIVRVERPGLDSEDQHSSENGLSDDLVDYTMMNDDTIEVLHENVEVMLTHLGEKLWAA